MTATVSSLPYNPDPGIEPVSPALQVDSLPLSHWGSQKFTKRLIHHEQVGFIEAV